MKTPYPPKLRMTFGYPVHIEYLGPVECDFHSVPTASLGGADLDFAVAASVAKEGSLTITFLPAGVPSSVSLESGVMPKRLWNPSTDEELAKQVLASTSVAVIDKFYLHALRELVKQTYGDEVDVLRLRHQSQ